MSSTCCIASQGCYVRHLPKGPMAAPRYRTCDIGAIQSLWTSKARVYVGDFQRTWPFSRSHFLRRADVKFNRARIRTHLAVYRFPSHTLILCTDVFPQRRR